MLRVAADTLVIWDEVHARITWLTPGGEVARVEPRPGPRVFHVGVLLPTGSRVIPVYPDLRQPTTERLRWRPNGRIAHVDHATGRIDTLGTFLGAEMALGAMMPVIRDMRFATNGMLTSFVTGDNARFDLVVHEFGAGGPPRQTMRIREMFEPEPVSDAFVREWQERTREAYSGQPREAELRPQIESPVVPPSFPAFADIRLDEQGFIWVERFRTAAGLPRAVTIFDSLGMPVGRAEYPEGLEVLEIGADYLLGTSADSLNVLSIRRHPLQRAGPVGR